MPEKSLEKTVEKDIKIAEKKFHKMNIWMITSIALIIILAGVLIFFGSGNNSGSSQSMSDKAV